MGQQRENVKKKSRIHDVALISWMFCCGVFTLMIKWKITCFPDSMHQSGAESFPCTALIQLQHALIVFSDDMSPPLHIISLGPYQFFSYPIFTLCSLPHRTA